MIKIGDRVKDNDPRETNRILTIIGKDPYDSRIEAKAPSGRVVKIKKSSIHPDSKPRRSGFDPHFDDG